MLCVLCVRGGKADAGLSGAGASVGRACGPTALQRSALASRRTTRGVRCAHSAQTRSTSQFTKRAGTCGDARPNLFRRHLLTARTGQASLGLAATEGRRGLQALWFQHGRTLERAALLGQALLLPQSRGCAVRCGQSAVCAGVGRVCGRRVYTRASSSRPSNVFEHNDRREWSELFDATAGTHDAGDPAPRGRAWTAPAPGCAASALPRRTYDAWW